jgi:hypothetical protein
MVAHSGTAVRADRLRPLNGPRPVRVEADARGWPVRVGSGGGGGNVPLPGGEGTRSKAYLSFPKPGVAVSSILDRWRIDDEWWRPAPQGAPTESGRKPISRMYFHVMLASGQIVTLFQDLIEGGWFVQTTATPRRQLEPVAVLAPRASAPPAMQRAASAG